MTQKLQKMTQKLQKMTQKLQKITKSFKNDQKVTKWPNIEAFYENLAYFLKID
jgi:uncharacterized coiled-coil protein SlyX